MNRTSVANWFAARGRNALLGLLAAGAVLPPASAVHAQAGKNAPPPATRPGETILRPGDELRQPLGTDKSRAEVVRRLEELIASLNLKAAVIDELRKNHFDGTPQSAIRIAAVDLSLSRDEAVAYGLVTSSLEGHRFQVWRLLGMKRSRLAECERNRDARGKEVEVLADQIARATGNEGTPLTAAQLDDLRSLLYVKILHRRDLDKRCQRLGADCDFYKGEIAALGTLDQRIEAMTDRAAVHLLRQMDAVESEEETLIAQDVKASQEDLRKMIAVIGARRATEPQLSETDDNIAENRGTAIESAIGQLKRELPAEAEQLIQDELQKAQTRLKPTERGPAPKS
jgi:hypothetical protein